MICMMMLSAYGIPNSIHLFTACHWTWHQVYLLNSMHDVNCSSSCMWHLLGYTFFFTDLANHYKAKPKQTLYFWVIMTINQIMGCNQAKWVWTWSKNQFTCVLSVSFRALLKLYFSEIVCWYAKWSLRYLKHFESRNCEKDSEKNRFKVCSFWQ